MKKFALLFALRNCALGDPERLRRSRHCGARCHGSRPAAPPLCLRLPLPAATEAPAAKAFRVALIMPSTINDLAFGQSMYDALVKVQTDMGGASKLEIVKSENVFTADDAAAAMRDYATQGYNLIIAHGSQYGSAVQQTAPDFPKTSFAWGTTVDTFGMPNVFAYEAASQEGGYVNGVVAATLSKSQVFGVIGPIETGDAKLYVDGFKAGVLATKPNAKVNVVYTDSFSDTALAAEAASTDIAAGADVLTGTAQMVVGAIGKAKESNVLWFGTQANRDLPGSLHCRSQPGLPLGRRAQADDRCDPVRHDGWQDIHHESCQWRRGY